MAVEKTEKTVVPVAVSYYPKDFIKKNIEDMDEVPLCAPDRCFNDIARLYDADWITLRHEALTAREPIAEQQQSQGVDRDNDEQVSDFEEDFSDLVLEFRSDHETDRAGTPSERKRA